MVKSFVSAVALLALATPAVSVCGVHSFTSCADGIVHWFDPLTGEICDPLDCGGGRAPVKTNVPGCPAYKGTATRATSASYLSCWTPSGSLSTGVHTLSTTTSGVSATKSGSGSGSATVTPPTTQPPTGTGASAATSTTSRTVVTPNVGNALGGPLVAAVAGAALGAVAML